MPVHVQSYVRRFTFDQARLERSARVILADVGEPSAELGILFVGDQRMRGLNRRYLGKDRTTDVLAFAMREACTPHVSRLTPHTGHAGRRGNLDPYGVATGERSQTFLGRGARLLAGPWYSASLRLRS